LKDTNNTHKIHHNRQNYQSWWKFYGEVLTKTILQIFKRQGVYKLWLALINFLAD